MGDMAYTPPLGFSALTPLYDRAIASLTREGVWRSRLVRHLSPEPGETILDVGAGTGTLAILVSAIEPCCSYRGIDPDGVAVGIARRKAALAGSSATFDIGSFGGSPASNLEGADKVVCSLVLHQVPLAEKRRLLQTMLEWLKPGGHLFVADYGSQQGLAMRLAFRLTVQLLDGKADTQPNADGVLPLLIAEAGFQELVTLEAIDTPTGRIEIMRAQRPLRSGKHR
jgi:ubiquinone/menaquinone biosynthesis C-methylase UbiE